MSRVRPARRAPIAPRFDRLEPRELLAKAAPQVAFAEVPNVVSAYDLIITGTSRNDSITIVDDGTQAAGSIRVSTSGGQSYVSEHSIRVVQVLTGGGKDALTYDLPSGLQAGVQETLFASSGGTPVNATKAIKGGGTLRTTVDVAGMIPATSGFYADCLTDAHAASALSVSDAGTIAGTFSAELLLTNLTSRQAGPVTFDASSVATIAPSGLLNFVAQGGKSKNLIHVSYDGTSDGKLLVDERGAGAKDDLAANLAMTAASTGTVGDTSDPALVASSGKGAKVRFAVFRGADSTTKAGISAVAMATSKKSMVQHTANVLSSASGTEMIIT